MKNEDWFDSHVIIDLGGFNNKEDKMKSEEYDSRKTKRKGRRNTILTSQRGASGNFILGKPTLLGA